jgi:hypothetical protein
LQASAKRPLKGKHTNPCKKVERFPQNPIGHPLDDIPTDLFDSKRHLFVLDRISDPSTFDPDVRFSAIITESESDHKLNLNYSITPLNKRAVQKTFYFRTVFQVAPRQYVNFAHYLFHFESCEVDVDMEWNHKYQAIVEVFEFREGPGYKVLEMSADKGL